MPAQLVALTEGPSILLDKPIMLFGRNPECDIQIDSRKVSRRHCCVAQVNDYLVVRDLGSTNGIRVNGVRMVEGQLRHGDELTIGSHRYQVRWEGMPAPAVRPAEAAEAGAALMRTVPEPEEEDNMLEECDEPVPLREPGRPAPANPSAKALPHDAKADSKPPVLPPDLELAPNLMTTERAPERPGN
jgi:predicted component of type VI protein secretion system